MCKFYTISIFLLFEISLVFGQEPKHQDELDILNLTQVQRGMEDMLYEMKAAQKAIKPLYSLKSKLVYESLEPGLGKKKALSEITFWSSPSNRFVMLETNGRSEYYDVNRILIDQQDSLFITFQGRPRNGFVTVFPAMYLAKMQKIGRGIFMGDGMPSVNRYNPEWENAISRLKPTSETKTIAGVRCNGYRATTPDGVFNFWFSELEHPMASVFETIKARNGFPVLVFATHPEGSKNRLLMEAEQWNLQKELVFNFHVKSFEKDETEIIETKFYQAATFD